MTDERIKKLAYNLVNFSCALKPGDKMLIESIGGADELARELVRETYKAGGIPFLWLRDKRMDRELLLGATEEQFRLMAENDAALMAQMQAYVGIRAGANSAELSDVPAEKQDIYARY